METFIAIASAASPILLLVGYWILPRLVDGAVKASVDTSVGKALADYKLPLDKQLEEHRARLLRDVELHARDYGLFAERRNGAYAKVYEQLARAHGAFSSHYSFLTVSRDFSSSPEPDVRQVAEKLENISPAERAELVALLDAGNIRAAGEYATVLYKKDALIQANKAFFSFRNALVLESLFFTPAIDALLEEALQTLVPLSMIADEHIENENVRYGEAAAAMREVNTVALKVRNAMRAEMQRPPATMVA